jgi:aarF domain-containing kinase
MVRACAERDRDGVIATGVEMGFLTGDESPAMMDAHVEAGFAVGAPFASELHDFGAHRLLTRRVAEMGAVMVRERLAAPPPQSYSLHRRLSGAFLTCIKLRARVPCRALFYEVHSKAIAEAQEESGRREALDVGA